VALAITASIQSVDAHMRSSPDTCSVVRRGERSCSPS
jgi:hypothetical protein